MQALHPIALALAETPDEDALRAGLRALAESSELPWAVDSLLVVAHRLSQRGEEHLATRVVAIASEAVPSLTEQSAARDLDRLAEQNARMAALTGAPSGPRALTTEEPEGTASFRLSPVLALPRRA